MAIHESQRTTVDGVACDSTEEEHMVYWLGEAVELGLLHRVTHKPYTLRLNNPVKHNGLKVTRKTNRKTKAAVYAVTPDAFDKKVIAAHTYTPDFEAYVTDAGMLVLGHVIHVNPGRRWIVDVKGSYSGGTHNASSVTFPLKQVLVQQQYGVVVQKIVPTSFFYQSWLPQRCKYTKKLGKVCKTFVRKDNPYPERKDVDQQIKDLMYAGVLAPDGKLTDDYKEQMSRYV